MKKCRLCFCDVTDFIEIFSEQGVRLNINSIVSTHFSLNIELNDNYSNIICTTCWCKIDDFHIFYEYIKIAQDLYENHMHPSINKQIIEFDIIEDTRNYSNDDADEDNRNNFKNTNANLTEKEPEHNDDETKLHRITIVDHKIDEEFDDVMTGDNNGLQDDKAKIKTEKNNINNEVQDETETTINNSIDIFDTYKNSVTNYKRKISNNRFYNIHSKTCRRIKIIEDNKKSIKENNFNEMTNNNKQIMNKNKRDSPKSLQEDEKIRQWFRMECSLCTTTFYRFPDVKIHYRNEHSTNGYIICCNKKFFRRVRVLEHIAMHINPDAFKCDLCNKNFSDKPGLMTHMDGHMPSEKRPHRCDICDKSYAKKFQLNQHRKLRHITEADKKFICSDCGKAFIANSILQTHIRCVHQNLNNYICEICAKSFKSKLCFEQHFSEHKKIELPKLQCQICERWLKHENSLRSHMKRHVESTIIYTCDICGKHAPNKGALRNHQKYVHINERSYKCNMCSKAFKRALTLKEHKASHTGEILYRCHYCLKTFNSSANMHSHKKKFHTVQWQEEKHQAQSNL